MAEEFDTVLDIFEGGKLTDEELTRLYEAIGDVVFPDDEWRGSKPYAIVVGGEEFSLRFKGARQVAAMSRLREWLRDDLRAALDEAKIDDLGGKIDFRQGINLAYAILDPQIFVGLGEVLLNKDEDFVEEHFDLDWIIGGAEVAYNANKFIKRLTSAFFTRPG